MTPTRYDHRTIVFHWLSAALVFSLWLVGQTIDWFPRGDARVWARSLHITVGALLGLLLIARIYWRRTGGTRLPAADPGLQGRVAVGFHHLLYLLLLATVLAGIAFTWVRGDNLFNWFRLPAFDPGNKALRASAGELHEWLANALLVIALLHAAAAVWHHRIKRDNVLRRMWPKL